MCECECEWVCACVYEYLTPFAFRPVHVPQLAVSVTTRVAPVHHHQHPQRRQLPQLPHSRGKAHTNPSLFSVFSLSACGFKVQPNRAVLLLGIMHALCAHVLMQVSKTPFIFVCLHLLLPCSAHSHSDGSASLAVLVPKVASTLSRQCSLFVQSC